MEKRVKVPRLEFARSVERKYSQKKVDINNK